MPAAPILLSDRLTLRALGDADRPFLTALIADADVRRYLGGAVPADRYEQAVDRYYAERPASCTWLAVLREEDVPLGMVFLNPHREAGETELSFQFAASHWGQGYAFEASTAALSYARTLRPKSRFVAETRAANIPARKLLARLGFAETGRVQRFGAEQVLYAR